MKYFRLLLILSLIPALSLNAASNKMHVWQHPTVEQNDKCHGGYFLPLLEVKRVELTPDETILHFHAAYRPEFDFNFTSDSYLVADSVRYDVINPRIINTIHEGTDFCLHFPALPEGTASFDFINSPDFRLRSITDGSARRAGLIPSNWRDDKTGDWLIGLLDDCVIYDARFWNYVGQRPDHKAKSFEITDGSQTLKISVGKSKDGRRKFKIGNKSFDCSAVTDRTLPPYPVKDSRKLRDTGYVPGDSVEFIGWLKDMPDWLRERSKDYVIMVYGVTGGSENYSAALDSLGHFSIKFPMDNTGLIYADWGRSFLRNVLEPGQRYFLLYDYKLGQTLFMGTDSRLQNELMIYTPQWRAASIYDYNGKPFSQFFHDADSINTVLSQELDSVCSRYPTLSDRFRDVHLTNERISSLGFNIGAAGMPDSVVPYVMENCMQYAGAPYSLVREFPDFITYLMDNLNSDWAKTFDESSYEREIEYTPEERTIIERIDSLNRAFTHVYDSIPDNDAKEAYRQSHFKRNESLIMKYIQVLNGESRNRTIYPKRFIHEVPHGVAILDSMGFDPTVKDIWIICKAFEILDNTHSSLSAEVIDMTTKYVTNSHILDKLIAENEKYIRIERKASQQSSMVDASSLKGLTEGDKLIENIIAPHRGKFILMDIWGTWCAPCRQALSRSAELYERLKDFDIVYIYLASNSAENTWRNIIEEYNVKGSNVFHYNLPADQQAEIEKALKVNCYPSYRLVDRDGAILDIDIDPSTYGSLESLLNRLSGK